MATTQKRSPGFRHLFPLLLAASLLACQPGADESASEDEPTGSNEDDTDAAGPPEFTSVCGFAAAVGQPYLCQLVAAAPRDAEVTYGASGLPEGAELDPQSGLLTWTPTEAQGGAWPIDLEASTEAGTTTQRADIRVEWRQEVHSEWVVASEGIDTSFSVAGEAAAGGLVSVRLVLPPGALMEDGASHSAAIFFAFRAPAGGVPFCGIDQLPRTTVRGSCCARATACQRARRSSIV